MSAKKTQVLLVLGALVLFVLLFIAPKMAPKSAEDVKSTNKQQSAINLNATIEVYVNIALKNLEPPKKQSFDKLLALKNYDSTIVFWDKQKRPDIASYYTEELAKKTNTSDNWLKAGNRYYYAVQFLQDQTEIPVLYQCAMRCFQKCLQTQPNNVDAKIMLGSCYVEGTDNPMEGITILKQVEKTDSNNVKLQSAFASFSVKSGQVDKAIYRYNKILQLDTANIEVYLYLADIYEQQNNTQKTIEVLEKYAAKTNDVTARLEITKYIQQLKK
ncbi:MAG: tetratricopeptide repeat protein [Bacteroidota bacterium]|nr:tetratricopeptide repeat protein [Bacteroidota bacterium]